MSHHQPVLSPEGTPLADRTVGEIVAENPSLSRVFQSYRLDFCCQGAKTLRQACEKNDLPLDEVVTALEEEAASAGVPDSNPAELPPVELADYIVEKHHGYLRSELPRVHAMAQRVAQVHGPRNSSLVEVFEVFTGLFRELDSHMRKEEDILFPTIRAIFSDPPGEPVFPGEIGHPVAQMEHEHEEAGQALERLRELTNGYRPPVDACNTYRALFAGLEDIEQDTHRHIHLENSVLFPAAVRRYREMNAR